MPGKPRNLSKLPRLFGARRGQATVTLSCLSALVYICSLTAKFFFRPRILRFLPTVHRERGAKRSGQGKKIHVVLPFLSIHLPCAF